jgi:hypothetical protein
VASTQATVESFKLFLAAARPLVVGSLAMWNRPKKTTPWRALQVDANWGAKDDPIEVAAAPVIAALRALDARAASVKKKR